MQKIISVGIIILYWNERIIMSSITYLGIIVKYVIGIMVIDRLVKPNSKMERTRYFFQIVLLGVELLIWIPVQGKNNFWEVLVTLGEIVVYYSYLLALKPRDFTFSDKMAVLMTVQIVRGAIAIPITILTWITSEKLFPTIPSPLSLGCGYIVELAAVYFICLQMDKYQLSVSMKKSRAKYGIGIIGVIFYSAKVGLLLFFDRSGNTVLYIALTVLIMGTLLGTLWLIDWYFNEKEKKLLWEDNQQMSQQIHRAKEIMPALNMTLEQLQTTASQTEISQVLGEIHQLCKEQMAEYEVMSKNKKHFPSTGIHVLDKQIEAYGAETGAKRINFDLFVATPMDSAIKKEKIKELDFLRLVGDLMRNAIRAIERKSDAGGNILLVMGYVGENLQLDIYDDGTPFPIFILNEFGKRGNTEDGTGNGLSDTIEFLDEYHATYRLTEYEDHRTFSKGISIIWDGKNEKQIDSPRIMQIAKSSMLLS